MNGQTEGWTEPDGQTDMIVEIVNQNDVKGLPYSAKGDYFNKFHY